MSRHFIAALAGGAALLLMLLTGCAPTDSDPAAMAKERDRGLYSGPLLGKHEVLASVEIDNPTAQPVQLISASPTKPYNVTVVHAWAGPLTAPDAPKDAGILGVLRWPRDSGDEDVSYKVLDYLKPVGQFTVPAHSRDRWMITLRLRQQDVARSMRTEGTTVTYAIAGQKYTVSIPTALCFFTDPDKAACPNFNG